MKHIKSWLKSPINMLVSLVLIAVLGMGSIAYFTDVEAALNSFAMGSFGTDLKEDLTSPVEKKDIKVTNTGAADAYVRVRVDIPSVTYTYTDAEGNEQIGQAVITIDDTSYSPEEFQNSEKIPATGENPIWVLMDDGYWYLNKTLSSGQNVDFLDSIKFPGLWDEDTNKLILPEGTTLDMFTIPIVTESVQVIDGVTGTTVAEQAYNAFQTVAGATQVADGQ